MRLRGIRNQESGIGIPVKMLESGIRNRNQESESRRSDKSGIGRGEQNQELALAALVENRKGSGGTRMENLEAESGAKMGRESGERIRISEQKRN